MALVTTWPGHIRLAVGQVKVLTGATLLEQHAKRQTTYNNSWKAAMRPLLAAKVRMCEHLAPSVLGNQSSVSSQEARSLCAAMCDVLMRAGTLWLRAALRAPPHKTYDGIVMLRAAECVQMPFVLFGHNIELQAEFHRSLWRAFCRPDFWDWFMASTASMYWCVLLLRRGVDSQHFTGMPLPALAFLLHQAKAKDTLAKQVACAVMEQHPALSRAVAVYTDRERAHNASTRPARVIHTDDGGHQGSVNCVGDERLVHDNGANRVEQQAADRNAPSVGKGVADADDAEDWFDMHALLRLMYGESGKPAYMQTG